MPSQITDYKCPACTGPLHFDSATGKMLCDYCGTAYSVDEIEALYAEQNAKAAEAPAHETASSDWGAEGKNMAAYSCPNCGAELIYENTVAVAGCPYCGNNTVIPGQFKGALKPDYVIPFTVTKEAAMEKLKAHMNRYKLVPPEFIARHTLEETKSVYVPYWLFGSTVGGTHRFDAQSLRRWEDRDFVYTETSYYHVTRTGETRFKNVPVDASVKMDDTLMESVEPYDYSALTPFKAAYLAGYPTDRYDVGKEEAAKRALERMRATFSDEVQSTVTGYTQVAETDATFENRDSKPLYALMPLWLMHVKWEGQTYTFAINGQTGQTVGNLPMSKKAYWKWHLIYTAIFFGGLTLLFWIIRLIVH